MERKSMTRGELYELRLATYWLVFGIVGWFGFAFCALGALLSLIVPDWKEATLPLVVFALFGLLLGMSLVFPISWLEKDEPTQADIEAG